MLLSKKLHVSLWSGFLALSIAGTVQAAGSLTGNIGVTLNIGEGCTVSNGSASGGTNQWGTLDFGTYSDLTNVIDGSVTGNGLYGNGSVRNVSSDGGTTLIPYRLYSDSARSSEIALNGSISLAADGTAQDIPIYGRVLPADQSTTAPAAGTYTDTVVATLSW